MIKESELISALYDNSYENLYQLDNDGVMTELVIVHEDTNICYELITIQTLVKKITMSNNALFSTKEIDGKVFFHPDLNGRKILNYIWHEPRIKTQYPRHNFSPYVETFFKVVEHLREKYKKTDIINPPRQILDDVVKTLNDTIDKLRIAVNCNEFKTHNNKHLRSSNKNYSSLKNYIDALFKAYSTLLVLRIDFGYATVKSSNSFGGTVDYTDVKRHRQDLFKELKTKLIPEAFLGFCWKLEYGLSKSFSYHCMIFVDGSKIQDSISLGRMIGDLWQKTITSGKGVYFNCIHSRLPYRSCGTGISNYDNFEMRKNLLKAAIYLTKIEIYIKISLDGKGRSFGRGNMPDTIGKG